MGRQTEEGAKLISKLRAFAFSAVGARVLTRSNRPARWSVRRLPGRRAGRAFRLAARAVSRCSSSAAHLARLSDRPIFRSSLSTRRILTSTSWPTLSTSSGFSTFWSEISRDVQQAFEARLEFHEHAEVGDLGDLALDDHARAVVGRDDRRPRVFLHLLEAQGDALLFLIDAEDDRTGCLRPS